MARSRYEIYEEQHKNNLKTLIPSIAILAIVSVWFINNLQPIIRNDNRIMDYFLTGMLTLLVEVMAIKCTMYIKKGGRANTGKLVAGVWIVFVAALAGFISSVFYPDIEVACYLAILLMMAGTLMAQLVALDQYNIMTSMPLPQLDRKGGES